VIADRRGEVVSKQKNFPEREKACAFGISQSYRLKRPRQCAVVQKFATVSVNDTFWVNADHGTTIPALPRNAIVVESGASDVRNSFDKQNPCERATVPCKKAIRDHHGGRVSQSLENAHVTTNTI
jgi:hypothetical protein